jgi:hypothetical protein
VKTPHFDSLRFIASRRSLRDDSDVTVGTARSLRTALAESDAARVAAVAAESARLRAIMRRFLAAESAAASNSEDALRELHDARKAMRQEAAK